jgi:ATP-dependent Zn protease
MATKQQPPKKKMSNLIRISLFWAILVFIVLATIAIFSPQSTLKEVSISDVINRANSGQIKKLEIQGDDVKVTVKDRLKNLSKSRAVVFTSKACSRVKPKFQFCRLRQLARHYGTLQSSLSQ